jgi:hypothetical protein
MSTAEGSGTTQSTATAEIIAVTGGVGGGAATYDAVRRLADLYDETGSELRGWAALGARTVADPDLVESALLSPLTFAEAEATVLAATTGPDGVLVESVGWEADAVAIRAALTALQAADLIAQEQLTQLDRFVAPVLLAPALLGVPGLPPDVRDGLEQWVVDHPGLLEHGVHGLGAWLPAGPTLVAGGATTLLYGTDEEPDVHPVLQAVPGGGEQPVDLEDLVEHLQDVAHLSPDPDSVLNGTIEIQTFDQGTDDVRHIVYLPGTDDITTLPGDQDDTVRDTAGDGGAYAGIRHAYQQGILEAMTDAGIGPHDPVLLVGHSLGGIEAATILSQGSDFNITDVVTAGAPTAQLDGFPAGSHVLSLEHHGDVVPLVDGAPNPDSVEQVTVTFQDDEDGGDDGGGGIVDHHELHHYVEGAAAVDASTDASVQEQLATLQQHGFLAGDHAPETAVPHVWQIERAP